MNGDDEYGAGPYQLSLIDNLRRAPTLSAPTQGTPRPGTSPTTRQRYQEALTNYQAQVEQRPDTSERERVARGQYEAAGEDIAPAILLQALGGKLAPWGGQVLQRSMAARGPQKVTGGEYIGGQFVEDPYAAQERRLKGQGLAVSSLRQAAEDEETAVERERSHRASEQAKADAERRHQEQQREARASRYASQSLAERRFQYEQGKEKFAPKFDAEGNYIGRFNAATGTWEPQGGAPGGGMVPVGGPAATPRDVLPKGAPDAEKKLYGVSGATIERAGELIKHVEANPDAFGPMIGRSETLRHTTGVAVPGMRLKPEQETLRGGIYLRAYETINDLAGAALSPHESGRIMQFVPGPNDDVQAITSKLKAAIEEARSQRSTLRKRYQIQGDDPFGALPGTGGQTATGTIAGAPRGTPVGSVPEVSREPTKALPGSPPAPGGPGWRIVETPQR